MPGVRALAPGMVGTFLARTVVTRWQGSLRLSVRGLAIFVLVIAVALGWLVRIARIQRDAVAAIQRAGGQVAYDWEQVHRSKWTGKLVYPAPNGRPIWPQRLIEAMGPDYFGDVVKIRFQPNPPGSAWSQATDEIMSSVGRLHGLNDLDLTVAPVTDAGMQARGDLTNLESLDLTGTKITGQGLACLPGIAAASCSQTRQRTPLRCRSHASWSTEFRRIAAIDREKNHRRRSASPRGSGQPQTAHVVRVSSNRCRLDGIEQYEAVNFTDAHSHASE